MNTRHHVSIALFAPPALLGAILPAAALDGAPHAELPSWMAGQWLDPAGQTLWREFWEAVFAGTWSVPFTLLLIGIGLLALCATGMVLFLLASLIVTIAVALGLLPAKRQPHDKGPRRARWIETLDNPEIFIAFSFDLFTGGGGASGRW